MKLTYKELLHTIAPEYQTFKWLYAIIILKECNANFRMAWTLKLIECYELMKLLNMPECMCIHARYTVKVYNLQKYGCSVITLPIQHQQKLLVMNNFFGSANGNVTR